MPLFAHSIRFGKPSSDFAVHLIDALEPEGMQMISRRERFDAAEAGIFAATREHDMPVDPVSSNDEGGKTHSDLKRDSRFFGEHLDGSVALGDAAQFIEDRADGRRFPGEMGRKRVATARMGLIPVCKLSGAVRATPHRSAHPSLIHRSGKNSDNAQARPGN